MAILSTIDQGGENQMAARGLYQWILAPVIAVLSMCSVTNASIFNVSNVPQFRQALENAAVNGEDDTIILDAGIYRTTDDGLGTFYFSDTEAHNITIKAKAGLTYNDVILDGNSTNSVLSVTNSNENSSFTLDGISIMHGHSVGDSAGIYSGINLVLINSRVSDNTGRGIFFSNYYVSTEKTISITNSIISNNHAPASNLIKKMGGGGLYAEGYNLAVAIIDSAITNNTAVNGGGIFARGTIALNIAVSGSSLSYNQFGDYVTGFGGAIYADATYNGSFSARLNLDVSSSTIVGNVAQYPDPDNTDQAFYAGGIYLHSGEVGVDTTTGNVTLNIIDSTLTDNSNGGILVQCDCSYYCGTYPKKAISIFDSKISNNADFGLRVDTYAYEQYIDVVNSLFSNHTVRGIDTSSPRVLAIVNSTFSQNATAIVGGGYNSNYPAAFINNIFNNNSVADINITGDSNIYNNYIDYTKILSGTGFNVIKKNNIQPSAGSLNFSDVDLRLGAGSVAIDKGLDPSSATFASLISSADDLANIENALGTDKDGNMRIVGATIDIGAYEFNSLPIPPVSTLSIMKTGIGSGSAMSSPPGINCNAACPGQVAGFSGGTFVSLSAIPAAGGSIFVGWSGDNDCRDGRVTMNTDVACLATFDICSGHVSLIGVKPYDSISAAYAGAAASGDTIRVIASNQQEVLNLTSGKNITLNGGYDCSFGNLLSYTAVTGSLTISNGTLTIANIVIN